LSQSLESVRKSKPAHRLGGVSQEPKKRSGDKEHPLFKPPSPPERRSGGETPSGAGLGCIAPKLIT
jgi:hypothetical protein